MKSGFLHIRFLLIICFFTTAAAQLFGQCNADFSFTPTTCRAKTTAFTFTGSAAFPTFRWDFGDYFSLSNYDSTRNPVHTYDLTGSYDVTLIVIDSNGCTDTVTKSIRILQKPLASFTVTQTCVKLGTEFTSSSTKDSADKIVSYQWYFGDGGSDTARNPIHTYSAMGTKNISLEILTLNGCRDTIRSSIPIFDEVLLSISRDSGCQGDFVNFTINPGTSSPSIYNWDFGDATTSFSQNTSHQYNSPGSFIPAATLTYSNGSKCIKFTKKINIHGLPDPQFTIIDSIQCYNKNSVCIKLNQYGSSLKSRVISFDDGFIDQTSSLLDSIICYSYGDSAGGKYVLSIDVTDKNLCKASYTSPTRVTIFPEIEARFAAANVTGCFQTNYYATNYSNISPPQVTNFLWNFGDGNTSNASWNTISHTYTKDGVFDVSLIISNANGCTDTFIRRGAVNNTSFPVDAVMDTAISTCRSTNIFKFRQSFISSASIFWDFNNFDTAFVFNPDYHYPRAGIYYPKVFIIKNGCSKTIYLDTIFVSGPEARIDSIVNQFQCSIRDTVTLNNTSIYLLNKSLKFFWDIGDTSAPTCTTDTKNNSNVNSNCNYSVDSGSVRHMFTPGTEACYFPTLIVSDTVIGCSDTFTAILPLIKPNAKTGLTVFSKTICLGPEPDKTVELDLSMTQPGCGQQNFWVMWDSTCAAGSNNFDSFWRKNELTHNYGYDICDSSGRISIGIVLQNGTDTGNRSCSDTGWYHHILDFGRVNPTFTSSYDPTKHYCKNSSFTFTIQDQNMDSLSSIFWQWGDGKSESAADISPISHTYARAGRYRVILFLQLKDGCSANDTLYVQVGHNASFSPSKREICLGDTTILYKNITYWNDYINYWNDTSRASAGLESLEWDYGMGNGFSSTDIRPEFKYPKIGNYTIRMATKDSSGCRDTFSYPFAVRVFSIKTLFTTLRDSFTCAQLVAFKSNVTLYDSVNNFGHFDDRIVRYNWTFASNLSGSVLPNPTKFLKAGTFNVKLMAENSRMCRDSIIKPITILGPTALFEFDGDSTGCQGQVVKMKNTSYNSQAYTWLFGDGSNSSLFTGSDTSVYFKYPQYGDFYPGLIAYGVMTLNGVSTTCSTTWPDTPYIATNRRITIFEDPKPNFSYFTNCDLYTTEFTNLSIIYTDTILRYEWDFGDGDTSMQANPFHQFSDTGRYMVTLRAWSSLGCMGTIKKLVIIAPYALVSFGLNDVCLGVGIRFMDSTITFNDQVKDWLWEFGDNTSSTLKNPLKVYSTADTFNVKLTITNFAGCKSDNTLPVIVHARGKTSFTYLNKCFSEAITFTNTSTSTENPLKYTWDLAEGDTSSTSGTYSKIFKLPGNYSIKLKSVTPFGCEDSFTRIAITYPLPIAGFSFNHATQCLNGNVFRFTDSSKTDTGKLNNFWSFGDSSFSILKNPAKTYSKPGKFNIIMESITPYNCRDTAYDSLLIHPSPVSKALLPKGATQCINPNAFTFINTSSIPYGSFSSKWHTGDGKTSTDSIIYNTYKDSGTYIAKLTTLSDKNCPDTLNIRIRVNPKPKASFNINNDTQCLNTNRFILTNTSIANYGITSSRWFFGDGDSSNVFIGSHRYKSVDSFKVLLIATNNTSCKDTVSRSVLLHTVPDASYIIKDSIACENNNLFLFSNTSKIAYGSMKFTWNFGDTKRDSINYNTRHNYDTFGTYKTELIALSNNGCRDTARADAVVFPMPHPSFSANDTSQCLNSQDFIFSNNTKIGNGTFSSFWKLGESDTSSGFNARKKFRTAGIFNIKLVTISNNNCSDSSSMSVTVFDKPYPLFTVNDTGQCENNQNFIFTNITIETTGPLKYTWSLGNGQTDTSKNLQYLYPVFGSYNVSLSALSSLGCVDSSVQKVQVFPKPAASIAVDDSGQCINTNVFRFHASSIIPSVRIVKYFWNIDGQYASGTADTSKRYIDTGKFTVSLITESDELCVDTSSIKVQVHPIPNTGFTINDSVQCENDNLFTFTNQSIFAGPLNFKWIFGDGNIDSSYNSSHIYSAYDSLFVKLVAFKSESCSDTMSKPVIIHPKPRVNYTFNDSDQCLNGNRFIVNNSSSIPYGILNNTWLMGNRFSSDNLDTGYIYSNAGLYKTELHVVSSEGCRDSASRLVAIRPKPVPAFTINNRSQCINNNLFVFDNLSNIDSGTIRYIWNSGDGNTYDSTDLSHSYLSHGLYKVSLKAISGFGCSDSISRNARVWARPVADFSMNNSKLCVNEQQIKFNSISSIPEGRIRNRYWSFGDGSSDSGSIVSHHFDYARFYNIIHSVISDSGCTDSISRLIRIFPKPKAAFDINDTSQCLRNNLFVFTDKSYDSFGLSLFTWDLQGAAASGSIVKHSFKDTGYKNVRLILTSINGCSDTAFREVYVRRMPVPLFTQLKPYYCQFEALVNLVPKEIGGTFTGRNVSGTSFNPLKLWRDTIQYRITYKGCFDSSIQYTNVYPAPKVNLGRDTQLCLFEYITLNASYWGSEYRWFGNQVRDSQFTVNRPGTYMVTVTNICGEARDTIRITYGDHNCRFFMPNAFTPNGDDLNSFFRPVLINVPEMKMQIFNRWGEKLYEGNQDSPGWDGTFMGVEVPQDVYVWVVYYKYPLGNKQIQLNEKGTFHLLR